MLKNGQVYMIIWPCSPLPYFILPSLNSIPNLYASLVLNVYIITVLLINMSTCSYLLKLEILCQVFILLDLVVLTHISVWQINILTWINGVRPREIYACFEIILKIIIFGSWQFFASKIILTNMFLRASFDKNTLKNILINIDNIDIDNDP